MNGTLTRSGHPAGGKGLRHCFGLLRPIDRPWHGAFVSGLPICSGYYGIVEKGPARTLVFRLAALYGRNRLLRDLLKTWHRLSDPLARSWKRYEIHARTYPPSEVQAVRRVVTLARQAKVISHTRVRMRDWAWVVRPLATPESRRFLQGGWLELYGLLAATLVARRLGGPMPIGQVSVGHTLHTLGGEIDVLITLPNGKWVFVEAKMSQQAIRQGNFLELATVAGIPVHYRIVLLPTDRFAAPGDYLVMGPRQYLKYLAHLFRTRR